MDKTKANVSNEIINLCKNNYIDKVQEIFESKYEQIIKLPKSNICELVKLYNSRIGYDIILKDNNYKKKNYYLHYEVLSKYLAYIEKDLQLSIIKSISDCMYGQLILEKISNIMNNLSINNILFIINNTSTSWTFPVFLYYLKLLNKCNINIKNNNTFIINNYCNTDDRIYKYMVDNNNELNLLKNTEDIVPNIINNIFIKNIPNKYILRRLKYLNKIIPELDTYFNNIISNCISIQYLSIIPSILKYYYNSSYLNHNNIYNIVNFMCAYYDDSLNIKDLFIKIYDLLSTSTEKNVLLLCGLFKLGTSYGKKIINGLEDFPKIKPLLIRIFEELDYTMFFIDSMNTIEFRNMVDNVGFHNISTCFFINEDHKYIKTISIYYMMPFVVAYGDSKYSKHFNKLRYYFSKFIKTIKRKKIAIIQLKLYPIVKEIKQLNIKKTINNLPPYHLYPGQLQNLKGQNFLLKEKIDGVLADKLPQNIFPIFKLTNNIKAEYVEDLDLYLVFDIDDTASCYDRHLLIHSNHKYGQTYIPIINNEEEMIIEINKERDKLKDFLEISYNNYRWYPKPAWKITNIEKFIEPLIDIINMKNKFFNNNNNIKLDGVILTPANNSANNSREIKIKPKNQYTIDLLYRDNKWIDRDNYEWDINDNHIKDELKNNQIWRISPESSNNWVPTEIRYDKIKSNPHKVVINIIDLYNLEYKY
jgi:hypothetical protein